MQIHRNTLTQKKIALTCEIIIPARSVLFLQHIHFISLMLIIYKFLLARMTLIIAKLPIKIMTFLFLVRTLIVMFLFNWSNCGMKCRVCSQGSYQNVYFHLMTELNEEPFVLVMLYILPSVYGWFSSTSQIIFFFYSVNLINYVIYRSFWHCGRYKNFRLCLADILFHPEHIICLIVYCNKYAIKPVAIVTWHDVSVFCLWTLSFISYYFTIEPL